MRYHVGEDLEVDSEYYIECHSPGSRPSYPKLKSGKYILTKSCGVTNTFEVKNDSNTYILQEHYFYKDGKRY